VNEGIINPDMAGRMTRSFWLLQAKPLSFLKRNGDWEAESSPGRREEGEKFAAFLWRDEQIVHLDCKRALLAPQFITQRVK